MNAVKSSNATTIGIRCRRIIDENLSHIREQAVSANI